MSLDNTTPMAAREYDQKINATIPYYPEFYEQTLDVVEQCHFESLDWLDLGCGTGTLEELALRRFPQARFVLVDPSEKMLEQARAKLRDDTTPCLCRSAADIDFTGRFDVVTAIQSLHYMEHPAHRTALQRALQALRPGGLFIAFENVVPQAEDLKEFELLRWGRYQQRHGKTAEEARAHNARCGVNYFPYTVHQYVQLLQDVGFSKVHVFWLSYMQMGVYAFK